MINNPFQECYIFVKTYLRTDLGVMIFPFVSLSIWNGLGKSSVETHWFLVLLWQFIQIYLSKWYNYIIVIIIIWSPLFGKGTFAIMKLLLNWIILIKKCESCVKKFGCTMYVNILDIDGRFYIRETEIMKLEQLEIIENKYERLPAHEVNSW